MYVVASDMTGLDNSSTPMPASAIARQDARVAQVGRRFTDGNRAMADIIAKLTPPPATGVCDDFTSSLSLVSSGAFPFPAPGAPSPGGGAGGGAASRRGAGRSSGPGSSSFWSADSSRPSGSLWSVPGGGSTYPYGSLQQAASAAVPAWGCSADFFPAGPAPDSVGARAASAAHSFGFWGFVLGAFALAAVTGDRRPRR